MIHITDPYKCCGCSACVQACPKECIEFSEGDKGFRYPVVDTEKCINCGLCEKVCPIINVSSPHKPIKTYAYLNPNLEVRMGSSSGGFFSTLADYVINIGGVVFGACYDKNWEVVHDYTETLNDIQKFRGSKYVQSFIGKSYIITKKFLQEGRTVLFTGTSCQISGLKRFLQREYYNLICVDVVCHGVPSPLVWRKYKEIITKRPKGVAGKNTVLSSLKDTPVITGISFRDKKNGWKKYGFVAYGMSADKADKNSVLSLKSSDEEVLLEEMHRDNLYMRLFLNNLSLRPSCYKCGSKGGRCGSDFTIADFWGISEFCDGIDDDKGVSAVLVNNTKALQLITKLEGSKYEFEYNQVYKRNHSLEKSVKETRFVRLFWKTFLSEGIESCDTVVQKMKPSLPHRLYSIFVQVVRKLKVI